jgi:hypothetical protein
MKQLLKISLLLIFSSTVSGQILNDNESKQLIIKGLDKLYNYEFKEAETYFHQIRVKYPKHPIVPLVSALQMQWQFLPIEQNKKVLLQYLSLLEKCKLSAAILLEDPNKKAEATFFLLASHGYIALVSNYTKEPIKAANEARKAYAYLKDGKRLIDKNSEFLFTTGLYNFYSVQYPEIHQIVKPMMIFFENGNKKLGIQQLEQAVIKSIFSRSEAAFYLLNIFLKYESNYSKALIYSTLLHERYPNNLIYAMRHTESLMMNGKIDDALPLIRQLKRVNDKVYTLAGSLFEGFILEKYKKNDRAAAEHYANVLKMSPNERYTNDYFAMAYAGLARISIRSGDTERAEELYRKCLNYATYQSTISEAKHFLK